jgi:hypothetical protein
VGFDVTDQQLIRFSAFVRYWRKNGSTMRQYSSYTEWEYNETVHQLYTEWEYNETVQQLYRMGVQ